MIYLKEGRWPLSLAYDDEIIQEANNTYQLSFKFPVTAERWQDLQPETFLLADDLHGEQEFFIFEVVKKHGYVQVYANQVMTLLNGYAISTISVDRVPGQTVMSALAGAIRRGHPFSFFSDIMGRHSFNEKDVSVMDALTKDKHSILGQWGGDLVRDKYQVKLLQEGGRETEALFMFKKNLTSYEDSQSVKNLRTRIHFKKVLEGTDGQAAKTLAVTVDSPLLSHYQEIYEGTVEVTDQDVVDEAGLLAYGRAYYGRTLCDVVESSLSLAVAGEPDVPVRLFDVVSVHHERFGVDLRLKITSYRYAPMGKRLKAIGFGKIKTSLSQQVSSMASAQAEKVATSVVDDTEQRLQKQIENMDRAIDAEIEENRQAIADGIEQAKAAAEVVKAEISQSVSGAEVKANQALTAMQLADQKADSALAQVGLNVNLVNEAKQLADQAKSEAQATNRLALEKAAQLGVDLNAAKQLLASQGQKQTELTQRMATTETGLAGIRDQYSQLNQAVSSQTGQITAVTRQTADLQRGLDGVTERFENLRVGTRNYAEDYDFSRGLWEYSQGDSSPQNWSVRDGVYTVSGTTNTWRQYQIHSESGGRLGGKKDSTALLELEVGQTYTLSVEAKCISGSQNFWVEIRDNGMANYNNIVTQAAINLTQVTSEWQRYSVTFTAKPNSDFGHRRIILGYSGIGTVAFRKVELVKGSMTTDAGPAEEDFLQEFADYKRTVTENSAQLSQAIQAVDGKAEQAQSLVRQTATSFEQQLTATKALIPTEIGGRNLIKRTAEPFVMGHGITNTTWNGETQRTRLAFGAGIELARSNEILPQGNIFEGQRFVIERGKTYTQAIRIATDATFLGAGNLKITWFGPEVVSGANGHRPYPAQIKKIGDKEYLVWSTVTWERPDIYLRPFDIQNLHTALDFRASGSYIEFFKPKLEVGHVVSDWSPDPEDLVSTLDFNRVKETAQLYERVLGRTEGEVVTNVTRQVLTSQLYQTEVTKQQTDSELLSRMTDGVPLIANKNFATDLTGYNVYDNARTGHVNISRVADNLSSSGYAMMITTSGGGTSPEFGGFRCIVYSAKNKEFLVRIVAKIPIGRKIYFRTNSLGTGATWRWLSSIDGTGNYATYVAYVKSGYEGNFSDFGFWSIGGGTTPTVSSPLVWHVSEYQVYDITNSRAEALATRVTQLADSYAIKALNSNGAVLSAVNVATGGVALVVGQNKLVVAPQTTYILDGTIKNAMIESLHGGKITAGTVTSTTIATDAITADKLKVDQALFEKLTAATITAKDGKLQNLFATSVQAVDLTAGQIKTGVLSAINGSMSVNLDRSNITFNNNATIDFLSNDNGLRRLSSTKPSQFIKLIENGFYSELVALPNATLTVIGSNADRTESSDSAGFGGLRIWNGAKSQSETTTFAELVGNRVAIYGNKHRSPWLFDMTGKASYLIPQNEGGITHSLGRSDRRFADIHSTELHLSGKSLKTIINNLYWHITLLYAGNHAHSGTNNMHIF